jgi:hypothetical protein
VYVHTEEKIDFYKDRPDMDPIPRAAAVEAQAATMSDKDFHYAYADIFLSLRDFHTNYYMPSPHSCYYSMTAVSFNLIDSDDIVNNPRVVVNGFSVFKEILALSKVPAISVGDELLAIDGATFKNYYEANQYQTGGANLFGGYRSALRGLSFRAGSLFPMPKNDTMLLTMRSLKNNSVYTVVLPWVALSIDDCVNEAQDFEFNTGATGSRQARSQSQALPINPLHAQIKNVLERRATKDTHRSPLKSDQQENRLQRQFNAVFKKQDVAVRLSETDDSSISWGIYAPRNLGVISLSSFSPDFGTDIAVQIIRGLLLN